MRRFGIIFLMIFLMSGFALFSDVSSRVSGNIVDKDTKQPLSGVEVYLYSTLSKTLFERKFTDEKGDFKFDPVYEGDYYLQYHLKDYVSFLPEYYNHLIPPQEHYYEPSKVESDCFNEVFKVFNIKQGEIKHFKIQMEHGGTLKVQFFKKDSMGILPFKNQTFYLLRKPLPDEKCIEINNDGNVLVFPFQFSEEIKPGIYEESFEEIKPDTYGEFRVRKAYIEISQNNEISIKGLEPCNEYEIEIYGYGDAFPRVQNIKVSKNTTTFVSRTFDFTMLSTIRGSVSIKGKKPDSASIIFYKLDVNGSIPDHRNATSSTDNEGNYSCIGLSPGKYKVLVAVYLNEQETRREYIVEVVEGKTIEKDFNLN